MAEKALSRGVPVIAAEMTVIAVEYLMRPGKPEINRVMPEFDRNPCNLLVAVPARLGKLIVMPVTMAIHAVRVQTGIFIGDKMALVTISDSVSALQLKRYRIMQKFSRFPVVRRVALAAGLFIFPFVLILMAVAAGI